MPKINDLELYPVKGGVSQSDATAIGTDWEDNGKTKNLPIDEGGEGSINQDNKFRYIRRTITIGNRQNISDEQSKEDAILSELNDSLQDLFTSEVGLSVTEHQLIVFIITIIKQKIITNESGKISEPKKTIRKYLFPHLMGKGEYDLGDFTAENLELIYESDITYVPGPGDMNGHRDVVIDLGDITGVPLLEFLNEYSNAAYPNGYPLVDAEKDYYFFYTSDGIDYIYFFDALNSANGNGFYGLDGDELLDGGDLVLFYNGTKSTDPLSKYDWVPVRERIIMPQSTWGFPPMQRGEARILLFEDEKGIELPDSSTWVGGYSGINCGHGTYVRCLEGTAGGPFSTEGHKFFIWNSRKETGIFYYGTGGAMRPLVGKVGVLYFNMDTKVTYLWNPDIPDYVPLGAGIEGSLENSTTFRDTSDEIVTPSGDNIYIDVAASPNVVYRWNGTQYVPLGTYSTTGSEWGGISGNINNQTDLQNALSGKSNTGHTHSYNDLTDKPTIPSDIDELSDNSNLLFSGDYNDLDNKPTIPSAQVNSDWNAASGVAEILNKPTIPADVNELTDTDGLLANFSHITGDNIPKKDMGENMLVDSKLSETEVGVSVDGDVRGKGFIGKSVSDNIAKLYAIDLNDMAEHYILTMTDNTSISFSNTISNAESVVITLTVTGSYSMILPSFLKASPDNDSYDGTMNNEIVINIKRGGIKPLGYYTLKNYEI